MTDALLERFKPQLLYDSNEAFFADSASEWTDNPGNVLRRPAAGGVPEREIAAASPKPGQEQLRIGFLGSQYTTQEAAAPEDEISDPTRDYRSQYVAIRRRPGMANVMYGHAKEDSEGRLWLQYWFWYFYNDYNLAARIGLHEGDWEMVQFRMGDNEPDLAAYAQHSYAQRAFWHEVEKLGGTRDTPLVYVARGSHASYFRRGYHETKAWCDIADGRRPAPPTMRLEIVGDAQPGWVAWPGRWGDTKARNPTFESSSPDGPAMHEQWDDPKLLLVGSARYTVGKALDQPDVQLSRAHGHLLVEYDFTKEDAAPPRDMVVTVNSVDEHSIPPRTTTLGVEGGRRGTIETTIAVADDKEYDVSISTVDAQGKPSASYRGTLERAGKKGGAAAGVRKALARVVGWMRG